MKEIGKKFQKLGNLPLATLTSDITSFSKDTSQFTPLLPASEPQDSISQIQLNNSTVFILSQKSIGMNLYRMLNYTKPDKVFLQLRPDDVNPSNPSPEVGPEEIVYSSLNYKDCENSLKKSGFFITKDSKISGNRSLWRDRFGERASIYSALWTFHHDKDSLFLMDLPRALLYRTLSNKLTLMQLQSMFLRTCKMIGADPAAFSVEDVKVPMSLAYRLYPDVFDKPSVHYFSLNLIKASKEKSKIFCVAERETGKNIEKMLEADVPGFDEKASLFNTSIIRRESSEMVIEKIALLDVYSYGLGLDNEIEGHSALKRVFRFIEEVLETERKDTGFTMSQNEYLQRKDRLIKLYLSKVKMYSTYGSKKMEEGRDELKAEMMKQVIKGF